MITIAVLQTQTAITFVDSYSAFSTHVLPSCDILASSKNRLSITTCACISIFPTLIDHTVSCTSLSNILLHMYTQPDFLLLQNATTQPPHQRDPVYQKVNVQNQCNVNHQIQHLREGKTCPLQMLGTWFLSIKDCVITQQLEGRLSPSATSRRPS